MAEDLASVMKNSGLPTAETPQLDPKFPFNTPQIQELAAQEKEMLGLSGGAGAAKTHIVFKGGKKKYVVRVKDGKKFVQCDGKQVYLAGVRGKYNYV